MWKLSLSLILFAVLAVAISRKVKISQRYERSDKKSVELSNWKALDLGIDPTQTKEER